MNRFSEYRVTWILVFFDLPTETKKDRKDYENFRKKILNDGFSMFQFSIYRRQCPTADNANVHIKRVKNILPPHGKIGILRLTDNQCEKMLVYQAQQQIAISEPMPQLKLF
jgi:CRISPR-associated protein Cas2